MKLNKNFKNLKDDYLFAEVSKRVDAYKAEFPSADVISLGIGDVTQPLSMKVTEACKSAATDMSTKSGFRGYGPYDGYPFLKNAVIDYYKARGIDIESDEVFITDGAKNGIANFLDLFLRGQYRARARPRVSRVRRCQRAARTQNNLCRRDGGERVFAHAAKARQGRYNLHLLAQQPDGRGVYAQRA